MYRRPFNGMIRSALSDITGSGSSQKRLEFLCFCRLLESCFKRERSGTASLNSKLLEEKVRCLLEMVVETLTVSTASLSTTNNIDEVNSGSGNLKLRNVKEGTLKDDSECPQWIYYVKLARKGSHVKPGLSRPHQVNKRLLDEWLPVISKCQLGKVPRTYTKLVLKVASQKLQHPFEHMLRK
ncbi:hypothetical protein FF38_03040 [Lucilia cuprina]|uniref:Uncharacterized protein n=1 Tax=Lucilia cuprina TaxID=7375 RepID=A0A0L0CDY6_LUCCU|nr:hypothetical protein FF38_03040 [Lucilia cuprina]